MNLATDCRRNHSWICSLEVVVGRQRSTSEKCNTRHSDENFHRSWCSHGGHPHHISWAIPLQMSGRYRVSQIPHLHPSGSGKRIPLSALPHPFLPAHLFMFPHHHWLCSLERIMFIWSSKVADVSKVHNLSLPYSRWSSSHSCTPLLVCNLVHWATYMMTYQVHEKLIAVGRFSLNANQVGHLISITWVGAAEKPQPFIYTHSSG